MSKEFKLVGDVNHILISNNDSENTNVIVSCGDWEAAEKHGVTDVAKEAWTEEILNRFESMNKEIAKTQYVSDRQSQYPSIEDQIDMLWNDIGSGQFGAKAKESKFYKTIKKIKDDNPKPK